jgi:hypothetical protein
LESQSSDPRKGVWVTDTLTNLYDLWRDVDAPPNVPPDTTRTGYFMLVVSARDDAFVPDPSPDSVNFRAIHPKFEREVLVVSHAEWLQNNLVNPTCSPNVPGSINPTCNQRFLKKVFENALGTDWNVDKDWAEVNDQGGGCNNGLRANPETGQLADPRPRCFPDGVTLDEYARHRLVVYSHDDMTKSVSGGSDALDAVLAQYLDIGGNVWYIDRNPFLVGTKIGSFATSRIIDFTELYPEFEARWPVDYFDIEGVWYPAWRQRGLKTDASLIRSNDEFIGANRGPSPNLVAGESTVPEHLRIDKEHLDSSWVIIFRTALASQSPPKEILGVPGVPFVLRGSNSITVYQFESWRPELNNAHNGVVMSRFVGPDLANPRFKTAWLGCPLYFIEEEDVNQLIAGMLHWFLVADPNVL